jgi:hypothetical protein
MRCGECSGSIRKRWWCDSPVEPLFRGFVVASFAAGFAVHESVLADADVELRLAEATELIALALRLRHFALAAAALAVGGSGGHRNNLALGGGMGNVPLVTWIT